LADNAPLNKNKFGFHTGFTGRLI